MNTSIDTHINQQASSESHEQPAANGKRAPGLKIRARVGMVVRTSVKAGVLRPTGIYCDTNGFCSHSADGTCQ
jgi:hypothetical protein